MQNSKHKAVLKSILHWGLGAAIVGFVAWFLFKQFNWRDVWLAVREADCRWIGLGIVSIVGTVFVRAWRWGNLLPSDRPRFLTIVTALLMGQVANMVLSRSGELVRVAWVSREGGGSIAGALGSLAVEKLWDLLALLIFTIILLIWMPLPSWFIHSAWVTAIVLFFGFAIVGGALHWQSTWVSWLKRLLSGLPARWGERIILQIRHIFTGMRTMRNLGRTLPVAGWTLGYWFLGIMANWVVLRGFGFGSLQISLVLMVSLMIGSAVPIPGNLGVFEGIVFVTLSIFGISTDRALAVGLVLRFVVMAPPLIFASILSLWSRINH